MSMVISAACDKVATGTGTISGGTFTKTSWYADVPVPGLDPTKGPRVSVLLCNQECWGGCPTYPLPPCNGGTRDGCQVTGWDVPSLACVTAPTTARAEAGPFSNISSTTFAVDTGRVVVACGSHQMQTGINAADFGVRYQKVYVTIQQ